ncbi:NAD-dependent deacetylase [Tissierella praeacuta DSM 18095]|uniref:NAD-dependent protein deacetylase n=1 Tax=Tissierella praeacuta DSM 18095 TaxID=1123404 RepID=A0A1M4XYV2_9FIRM|nr:NAD-dependent protein deacylase [Tissierella praeacuta]SHE98609.1 NAD-dependent deacetylase [Tissierella praeacuta DSM 18095]SUP03394.1 NAD-dependent deacetylase [Tissierella praeacuta]
MTIEKLKAIIDDSDNIVFFGGAGVSTESNIPDFRSAAGLYTTSKNSKFPPEYMLSHTCYKRDTKDFFEFYKTKMIYTKAKPNLAHIALTELERKGKLKAIITQNIDGLHQMAESKNVLELHGSVHRNYCTKCSKFFTLEYILENEGIPICDECGGIVKPDVVLYEESLDMDILHKAIEYIQKADVLIVGGTSLMVYPAASLVEYYKGNKLILINKSETHYDERALLTFNKSIGEVLNSIL